MRKSPLIVMMTTDRKPAGEEPETDQPGRRPDDEPPDDVEPERRGSGDAPVKHDEPISEGDRGLDGFK